MAAPDETVSLLPEPRIALRLAIWGLVIAAPLTGPSVWHAKLGFSVTMALLLGTFPRPQINAKCFRKQWFVAFVPAYLNDARTTDLVRIESGLDDRLEAFGELGSLVMRILRLVHFGWIWDWLFPWLGGDYILWLRTASDERILAWQGNGEDNFRKNLEILEETLQLPVVRG
jgi:hypothetical protein